MDADLSHDLTSRMPIIPHETAGVECCGCIIAAVDGTNVELQLNAEWAVWVWSTSISEGFAGTGCYDFMPHSEGEYVPGFSKVSTYVVRSAEGVEVGPNQSWNGLRYTTIPAFGMSSRMVGNRSQ
jgi:hypothetical protein